MKFKEARKYRNRFKNEMNRFVANCRNDWSTATNRVGDKPYAFLVDRFTVDWLDWDPRSAYVLIRVYDNKYDPSKGDTDVCKYLWIPTFYPYAISRLWEAANEVACNMQRKEYR